MDSRIFVMTLAGIAGLTACSPSGSASYDQAAAKEQIRKLEESWAQVSVSGDPSVIDDIFADDFLGVAPDGTQYTKQGFIDDTRAHPLGFTSIELNEITVRFFGDVAVAQGSETFTRRDGTRGRFVWTDVLARRDDAWRIVAAEDVISPVGGETPAALFTGSAPSGGTNASIDQTRNAYVAAWKAASADEIAQLYAADAAVLYPNQPAVLGRGAIHDYFKQFFTEFDQKEFTLSSDEIEIAGGWAFDRGKYRWRASPRAGGPEIEDHGKYLVILKRQDDGRWLIARDMDNSDRAAAQSGRGAGQ